MSKSEIQFGKTHLRNHLGSLLTPHISDGIWSIYDTAKVLCDKNGEVDKTLKTFQNLLTQIPTWTTDVLEAEVTRILTASKCDYFDELITGVFLAYMRAFAALQYRSTADSIEIEFEKPTLHKFIHEVYKQVARGAWQHAYLFKTYATPLEQQARNRKDITTMLEDSRDTVIDSFLPWKDIAKNYFKDVPSTAAETVAAAASAAAVAAEEEDEDEPEEKEKPRVSFQAPEEDDDEQAEIKIGDELEADKLEILALDEPVSVPEPVPEPKSEEVTLVPSEEEGTLVLKQ